MRLHYFCPSKSECPYSYQSKTTIYGMGPSPAQALGKKLSLSQPSGTLVFFGSCGALDPKLRVGQSYLVNQIGDTPIEIPRAVQHLSQVRLISVETPINRCADKALKFSESQAQIVDCEFEFLIKQLNTDLISRSLFIRTVIDDAQTELEFLDGYKVQPAKLLWPRPLISFVGFIGNYFRYIANTKTQLDRVSQLIS